MRSGSGSGSDTDDVHDEGKNLSIRVRGSAAGADRIKSPSIADSIDGSLKVDSPRNPAQPTYQAPKPSRLMGTRPGAAGGGGRGQDQVDPETEVVPYSPPSISPKKKEAQTPPKKPPKPAKKEEQEGPASR